MSVITLEIKPDRLLMDSNFDGYKLSLQELKIFRKNLEVPVDKTFLNSNQYGLLHAKLFGLHNHLFGDQYDNFASVYFVDEKFNIQKIYVDSLSHELVNPVTVFSIPRPRDHNTGDYNVTLRFASPELAVVSDGMGTMYILDTKDKRDDDEFNILFAEKVLNNEDRGFVIADALFNQDRNELHVLLLHIQEDTVDRFITMIHWLTFNKSEGNKVNKSWGQISLRQLKTKGEVQYLHLEKNCEHIYVVSENKVTFVLNSEHPIVAETELSSRNTSSIYTWSQSLEEITIKIPLPESAERDLVKVTADATRIDISYNSENLLQGDLDGQIDSSLLTWTLGNDNVLEITLNKRYEELPWKELVKGDPRGQYIPDTQYVEEMNQRLQAFTSENEVIPQTGTTFNSQQVEECDFETDKSETFERISGTTNQVTHRIHLGSHQILLSPYLKPDSPPALGIRHDVDVCLWQPTLGENFNCRHEGTLLAFGYVQASKTNRKFITCSPNLDYAVISESAGHIFIYRQNKPLLATELKHRATGRRVQSLAQQQVISLPNQDILGIFAANSHLYVLGKSFIIAVVIHENNTE